MGQQPVYSTTPTEKYRPPEIGEVVSGFVPPDYNFGPTTPVKRAKNENILVKSTRSVGGGEVRLGNVDISEALRNEPTKKVARRIIDEVSRFAAIDEEHQADSTKGMLINMYRVLHPSRFTYAAYDTNIEKEEVVQESAPLNSKMDMRVTAAKMLKNITATRISSSAYKALEQKNLEANTPSVEGLSEIIEQKKTGGVLRPGKKLQSVPKPVDDTIPQQVTEIETSEQKTESVPAPLDEELHRTLPVEQVEERGGVIVTPIQSTIVPTPETVAEEITTEEAIKTTSNNPLAKLMGQATKEVVADNEVTNTLPENSDETKMEMENVTPTEVKKSVPNFMSRLGGEYSQDSEVKSDEKVEAVAPKLEEKPAQETDLGGIERNQRKLKLVHDAAATLEALHGDDWWKNLLFTGKVSTGNDVIPIGIENTTKMISWSEQAANNPVFQDLIKKAA